MNANATINRSNVVHVVMVNEENGAIHGTECGSDGRYGFRPHYRKTKAEVTCKKCLKHFVEK